MTGQRDQLVLGNTYSLQTFSLKQHLSLKPVNLAFWSNELHIVVASRTTLNLTGPPQKTLACGWWTTANVAKLNGPLSMLKKWSLTVLIHTVTVTGCQSNKDILGILEVPLSCCVRVSQECYKNKLEHLYGVRKWFYGMSSFLIGSCPPPHPSPHFW